MPFILAQILWFYCAVILLHDKTTWAEWSMVVKELDSAPKQVRYT